MQADVVCHAEDLPFADSSFDVAACRIAAHHFDNPARAVSEMARVAPLVVLEDTLYDDEAVEEAEGLRDPTHVRSYSEDEWRRFFTDAGLEVAEVTLVEKRRPVGDWLELTDCRGADAERVVALLGRRIEDGQYVDTKIVLRGTR